MRPPVLTYTVFLLSWFSLFLSWFSHSTPLFIINLFQSLSVLNMLERTLLKSTILLIGIATSSYRPLEDHPVKQTKKTHLVVIFLEHFSQALTAISGTAYSKMG